MIQALTIGVHTVPYPLIQGGMGVRISGGSLAGHVAKCGGVGLVAAAGMALNSSFYSGGNYLQADPAALTAELAELLKSTCPDNRPGVATPPGARITSILRPSSRK